MPPSSLGRFSSAMPIFLWKCDDALPLRMMNLSRALSVRKYLAIDQMN